MSENIIEAKNLVMDFPLKDGKEKVHAVSDLSITVKKGETLALVGESGCGKSTLGRMLIRLLNPTSGEVIFEGKNITAMSEKEFKSYRRKIQMVFQDPYASLNPRMKVRDIIAEPLVTYNIGNSKSEVTQKVLELMKLVEVPEEFLSRYPHQFSGGQRQRIGIARALALNPDMIVCDEPVSALDVSVQSQVLNLLKDLQEQMNLTYLFITHDLSVVDFIADRVCVMFLGKVCEIAPKEEIFSNSLHPYTHFLINAIPQPDPHKRDEKISIMKGEIPSPVHPPSGCRFRTRCPYATSICAGEAPKMREVSKDHFVACHNALMINH